MTKKEWKRRRWEQKRQKRHDRSMRRFAHSLSAFLDTPERGWFTFHATAP